MFKSFFANSVTTLPVAALLIGLGLSPAVAQVTAPIEGTWKTLNGTEINIAPCEDGFCGTLSWIVIPPEQQGMCQMMDKAGFGSLMLDYKNPDSTQQTRSLLGMQILSIKPTPDPNAYTASVYNVQDGSTNDVLLWVVEGMTLRLGGGCLMGVCAVTQDWPRVADRELIPDFSCQG